MFVIVVALNINRKENLELLQTRRGNNKFYNTFLQDWLTRVQPK